MKHIYILSTALAGLLLTTSAVAQECEFTRSLDFSLFDSPKHKIIITDHIIFAIDLEENLVRLDHENRIIPSLADSWEYDEASRSFIFHLAQDCAWSDGTGFTAHDIFTGFRDLYAYDVPEFSGWSTIRGSAEIVNEGADLDALALEVIDDYTIRIGIVGDPELALLSLSYVSFSPLPSHRPNSRREPYTSPNRLSISPYRVVSKSRNPIVLERNPHYCKDKQVSIDKVTIYKQQENYVELGEFVAGNLDMVRNVSEKQLQAVLNQFPEQSKPKFGGEATYRQMYLIVNPENNGLADIEIRSAIYAALDIDNLLAPRGNASNLYQAADTLFYDLPNYDNVPFSASRLTYEDGVKKLTQIMTDKGYGPQKQLKLTIATWPLPRFETVAKLLSSMLASIYFDIEFVKFDNLSDARDALVKGKHDLFVGSWVLDFLDVQNSWYGIYSVHMPILNSAYSMMALGLPDDFRDQVKSLDVQVNTTNNSGDRHRLLQKIERYVSDAHIVIPLYSESTSIIYKKEFTIKPNAYSSAKETVKEGCGAGNIASVEK